MPAEEPSVDFRTDPSRYRHIRMVVDGTVATLTLDVDERGSIFPGVDLKLNSYDLGVDIEIADAVQRLRFEHPEVRVVLLRSGKERVFCAGANIRMLATASHRHKVNFCKFTNETRLAIEDASAFSRQRYIAVIEGTAAGGGYELALAADHIILVDDGNATVSLPELPLLAVLPGTGGLTRLVDKRGVRRDLADVFCTTEEGVKGRRAVEWRLADEAVPRSQLEAAIASRVEALAAGDPELDDVRDPAGPGITLTQLDRLISEDRVEYANVEVELDRDLRTATITLRGPATSPESIDAIVAEGADGWMLRCARELDDAILNLRFNEPEIGTIVFKTQGDPSTLLGYEQIVAQSENWFPGELRLLWKRVLKRVDLTSRSMVALVEPGSCFVGTLAELLWAADRSYVLDGSSDPQEAPATVTLAASNFGWYPMSNGLTRLETRFLGTRACVEAARAACGAPLEADDAERLGLVTFALDDIDWEDEIRVFLEERAAFSPDALTGMEANLRFAGPETMETKIFARLTAWQNWIFQRPNAVGESGALKRYGTGQKAIFDTSRV
jgi:benzoyl-CoA-dihydrodiol lyase